MGLAEKIDQYAEELDQGPNQGHLEQNSSMSSKMMQEVRNKLMEVQSLLSLMGFKKQTLTDSDRQRWHDFKQQLKEVLEKFPSENDARVINATIDEIDQKIQTLG